MNVKTTVVNLTLEKCDVKICRGKNGKIPDPPEYGCFGNPYFLRDKNNEQERKIVIEKYRQYFNREFIHDPKGSGFVYLPQPIDSSTGVFSESIRLDSRNSCGIFNSCLP